MADEQPKDYSSVYCEPPVPPARNNNTTTNNRHHHHHHHQQQQNHHHHHQQHQHQHHQHQQIKRTVWSDGARSQARHSESTVDLRAVVARLKKFPQENRAYAIDTLNKHYSSFVNRKTQDQVDRASYRVYIQYADEKDTYVVRVDKNTLKAVRDKLPKRGNHRYFFKCLDNTCEEVESDESSVPFDVKDGLKQIYCHVFPL